MRNQCGRERPARALLKITADCLGTSAAVPTWLLPLNARAGARAHIHLRRYNAFVPPSAKRPGKSSIYKLETGGILIIGVVIFLLTLARYWHHIAWGAR